MSELVREVLNGHVGQAIRSELQTQIALLDEEVVICARKGNLPYEQIRYSVGVADGVRRALDIIKNLAATPKPQ